MAWIIGCCPRWKSISAYKLKCGFDGFVDWRTRFLGGQFIDDGCTIEGVDFGVGTTNCSYNRYTCERNENTYIPGPAGTGDCFIFGPGPEVSRTNTSLHVEAPCGDDYGNLIDEYTKEMLLADIDLLITAMDFAALDWDTGAEMTFDPAGTPVQTEGGFSYVAAYYTDDSDNPTWIQMIKLAYKPATPKICLVFWPQDGSPCTRTIQDVTIGEEVIIHPPDTPGYIEVFECCAANICE